MICKWPADQSIEIIFYRSPRQIFKLLATAKSRYSAIPECNNCFIIRSTSLFSCLNHVFAQTQTVLRMSRSLFQLFGGDVVGSWPMKNKIKIKASNGEAFGVIVDAGCPLNHGDVNNRVRVCS